jgi:hypothetical protein
MSTANHNANTEGATTPNQPETSPSLTTSTGVTRRSAIAGAVGSLALGVLGAKKALAQTGPKPLVVAGGLCEGHVVKFNTADSIAWVQSMFAKSTEFQTLYNYFTAQGMSFIFSRAKVYLHSATTVAASTTPTTLPGIVGILPSFVQVNRNDPFHDAVGILIDAAGYAYAGGVRVNHNPFSIQQFTVYDLVPGTPGTPATVAAHSISASELQTLSVNEAATLAPRRSSPAGSMPILPCCRNRTVRRFWP